MSVTEQDWRAEEARRDSTARAYLDALLTEAVRHAIDRGIWRGGEGMGERCTQIARDLGVDDYEPSTGRRKAVISEALRWAVWARDAYACVECGARDFLTCDHIVAESKGGPTELDNLRTLCRSCNSRKGNR